MSDSGAREKEVTILELATKISDQLLAMQNALGMVLNRGEEKDSKSSGEGVIPSKVDEITALLEWNNKKLGELRTILQLRILDRLG